jgi:hypothetical protein
MLKNGWVMHLLLEFTWDELQQVLDQALQQEENRAADDARESTRQEAGIVASGLVKAASLLASQYQWVVTNVPYLIGSKQQDTLKKYGARFFPAGKSELATMFLERCLEFCSEGGVSSVVLPQNWLFLISYKDLRQKLLLLFKWNILAWLGKGAFITPLDVSPILVTVGRSNHRRAFSSLDVSSSDLIEMKSSGLIDSKIRVLNPDEQLNNPDYRITYSSIAQDGLLGEMSECYQGLRTGDKDRFVLNYWENSRLDQNWNFFREPNAKDTLFGGMMSILYWGEGCGELHKYALENRHKLHDMHESGNLAWGKLGIAINEQGLKASIFMGEKFDASVTAIFLNNDKDIAALLA